MLLSSLRLDALPILAHSARATRTHPLRSMAEEGVLTSAKEGATTGLAVGLAVGAARAFLESKEFAQKSDAIMSAAAKSKPNLSPAALRSLRPSVRHQPS